MFNALKTLIYVFIIIYALLYRLDIGTDVDIDR